MTAELQARSGDAGTWSGLVLRRVSGATAVGSAVEGVVLTRTARDAVLSAQSLLETADQEAAARIDEANRLAALAAQAHLQAREQALTRREAALETALLSRLATYSAALDQAWNEALDELDEQATTVVSEALTRIVADVPLPDRIRACVRELLRHPERPDAGELQVAEEDLADVAALPDLPWPVRADRQMLPGTVRLVAARGRWECDLAGGLARLLEALADAGGARPTPPDTTRTHDIAAPPATVEQGA
jgi:vacuolar-type H+-ATPase subunit E/Vma4